MDLITVRETRVASSRSELVFGTGEEPLGGGTWLFSEAQPGLTGLVDLTSMGWTPVEQTAETLMISATCTIAELSLLTPESLRTDPLLGGRSPATNDPLALFWQCANSLLAGFKIWNIATVGGNIALALPAGPMTSLAASLDAVAVVWTADGGEHRHQVADLVLGVRETALGHGDVLRAIEIPLASLAARSGFRRIALSPLGRTGAMVIARVDPSGEALFTVTGGTTRPEQRRFAQLPSAAELAAAIDTIDSWYDDPHGAPDWRRAMSALFAEELRVELS